MYLAWLLTTAVVLAWPVPRLLPRWTALRRVPGPALWLWQCVSLGAVTAGLELAPLAILGFVRVGRGLPAPRDHVVLAGLAALLSASLVARLAARSHVVGRRLRRMRREHRRLVDLLDAPEHTTVLPREVRVLSYPTAMAYCVPGLSRRVVLTSGAVQALSPGELQAVLAHEWAHLRQRHDLVLEFFTIWHTAVPRRLRSDRGLETVHLLIELLADRCAARTAGRVPLARALVALARARHPSGTLGYEDFARIRLQVLGERSGSRAFGVVVYVLGAVALIGPPILGGLSLLGL